MKIIDKKDKYYPSSLLSLYEPPEKLYVLGDEKILNDFSIAIVGTRNPSKYGIETAKAFAYNLSKYNVNIISGMAKGIDSAAHIGTIMGKGKTVAVLGRRI